jgi:hypothetical protein
MNFRTIAQGIESGDIKVGSKILMEVTVKDLKDTYVTAKPKNQICDNAFDLTASYTKPIEVPPNCELVAVPKIGSIWQKNGGDRKKVNQIRVLSDDGNESFELNFFFKMKEPITKRTVTKAEAEEFYRKNGEEVEIV